MDYRKLDLNLLVVLDTLLKERGVNATARRLSTSQPNVSFALKKLRAFFHDDLLVRSGNDMKPTALAIRIREPVRQILSTIDTELFFDATFDPMQSARCFSITTSDIGELVFLPKLLEALAQRAPSVTLRCHSLPPDDLAHAMIEGRVDVALGYFPDMTNGAFLRKKLFDHPFICIARQHHPQIGGALTMEKFLQLGHIVVSEKGRSQELVEARLRTLGLSRRIQLESPHFMSVPLLVSTSDLISTVPLVVGTLYAELTPLNLYEPPFEIPVSELELIWHRSPHQDAGLLWFRKLIIELFEGSVWPAGHEAARLARRP